MLLSMLIRSPFVRATRFEFNGPIPSLRSGYGVADQMGKKDGFIAAFCHNPAAVRPQFPITQPENLRCQLESEAGYFRHSMVGPLWSLKGGEWAGCPKESCTLLTSNR